MVKPSVHIIDIEKCNKTGLVTRGAVRMLYTRERDGVVEHAVEVKTAEALATAMVNGLHVDNAELKIENGKAVGISGTTGSFTRFVSGTKPYIIITCMVNEKGNTLGYRVSMNDGRVKKIREEELLKWAEPIANKGGVPFQNAQFIPRTEGSSAFIRAYKGYSFQEEVLKSGKAAGARAEVTNTENNKAKMEATPLGFTKHQLAELEAAKKAGVDVGVIAQRTLSPAKMHILWTAMRDGANVRHLAHAEFRDDSLRLLCRAEINGTNTHLIADPSMNPAQIMQLLIGLAYGVDIAQVADSKKSAREMQEIVTRMKNNIWKDETSSTFTWEIKEFVSQKPFYDRMKEVNGIDFADEE